MFRKSVGVLSAVVCTSSRAAQYLVPRRARNNMAASSAGVTLVSYADGARFARSQRVLESLTGTHGVRRVISWNASSLQHDPLYQQHASAFAMLRNLSRRVREHRPFCMAFKPLALMITLRDLPDGEWVMWTDSSRWNTPRLDHSLLDAAAAMEERNLDAAWGTQHCEIHGVGARGKGHPRNSWLPAVAGAKRYALVSAEALDVYLPNPTDQAARKRAMAATHVLATNVFVKATPANRAIAAKWLRMAVEHPSAFCNCNQDQAALTLLVYNERLPRVDYCGPFPANTTHGPAESSGKFMRSQPQKNLRVFVHALAGRAFEVERDEVGRRLEELRCAEPLLRRTPPPPPVPPPPSSSSDDRRILFVLSTYVQTHFHARSLALTLFSLQQHHPSCRVIIVDKSSPAPISHSVLPTGGDGALAAWFKSNIQILRAPFEPTTKREYGGYAHGLAYLATSTGAWDKRNFEQFIFMQGSMLLSEPVPPVAGADADGCEVRAFQNVVKVGKLLLHGTWRSRTVDYLSGVGLLPINATKDVIRDLGGLRAKSANHNAVAASLAGLQQLLAPPGTRLAAGGLSVFDHPKPVVKMQSEFMTGLVINRLSSIRRRAAATSGSPLAPASNWHCPELAWRAPTKPENNTPESGFYKLHGSGFSWVLPADVVLTALMQLADSNQDGRASRSELTAAILGRPAAWSTLWHSACLAFPLGADGEAARFVLHGPEPPGGDELAALMERTRRKANATTQRDRAVASNECGRLYDSWYWAEKALTMLDWSNNTSVRRMALTGTLPPLINFERTWEDPRNDMYSEPYLQEGHKPLTKETPFWGARARSTLDEARAWRVGRRQLQRFAERLADGIFEGGASDERGLTFLELRRLLRRDGFLSSVVLPLCLSYPSVGATVSPTGSWSVQEYTEPRRKVAGYRSSKPLPLQLERERLVAFDFRRRLEDTVAARWVSIAPGQWRQQRWDNINNGKVLQCLASSGLFYLRAALACLRCAS